MSSSKKVITEDQGEVENWQLPNLEGDGGDFLNSGHYHPENFSREGGEERGLNNLTASQIEQIQKEAYDEGFQQGHQEGKTKGYEDGRRQGKDEGFQAGHSEGYSQAYAEGQKEMAEKVAYLEQIMSLLHSPFAELDKEVEDQLVTLAMSVAKHLVRRELKIDPGQVVAVVREALTALPAASRNVRLFLHPEDAGLVRDALSISDGDMNWKIVEDPIITRGGCRVMTETSQVDASVETRLAAIIAKALGGEREGDRGGHE